MDMAVVAEMAAFSHFKYIFDKYVYIKELKKTAKTAITATNLKICPYQCYQHWKGLRSWDAPPSKSF